MSLLLAAGGVAPPSSAPLWVYNHAKTRIDWPDEFQPVTISYALYFNRGYAQAPQTPWWQLPQRPLVWPEDQQTLPQTNLNPLYFWRSPMYGFYTIAALSPVLVSEDTIFQRTDTNSALLFFNRSIAQPIQSPLAYAKRAWDFSEDTRPASANSDILFFWRTQIPSGPTGGHFSYGVLSPSFVNDEPVRPPNDYSGNLFFWRTPVPVVVQTPDIVQPGQVPGWVPGGRPPKKPRKQAGIGPTRREGQVFGESYPPSPFILQPGETPKLANYLAIQQDLFVSSPEELHAALVALMSELL